MRLREDIPHKSAVFPQAGQEGFREVTFGNQAIAICVLMIAP